MLFLKLKAGPLGKGQLKRTVKGQFLITWFQHKLKQAPCVWKDKKDRVNLETKAGPLGKGQLKRTVKGQFNFSRLGSNTS